MSHESTEPDWDAVDAAIRATAIELLGDGPMQLGDLTTALRERGALAALLGDGATPDELEEVVSDALLDTEATWMFLDDNMVTLTAPLLDGAVFTHRVTVGELDRGVLDLRPDLELLALQRRTWTHGAGEVTSTYRFEVTDDDDRIDEHGSLVGPSGWLDDLEPDQLVAVRVVDGVLDVDRDVDPGDGATEAELIRAVFDGRSTPDDPYLADVLLLRCRFESPQGAFTSATLPFGELVARAGLVLDGNFVARSAEHIAAARKQRVEDELDEVTDEFSLDPCCRVALKRVTKTWHAFRDDPASGAQLAAGWNIHDLHEDFHHGDVAKAFVNMTLRTMGRRDPELDRYAHTLAEHRELESVGRYVTAAHATRSGAAQEGLDELTRAVAVDPGFGPALDLYGDLLADAGRPLDALAIRRRALAAGSPDRDIKFLTELVAPFTNAGRNDPCPCGSGRKFKQCCQNAPKLSLVDRRRLALHQVTWSVHDPHRRYELMSLALTAMSAAEPPDEHVSDYMMRFFTDPLLVDSVLFDEGGLDDYLAERHEIVPEAERDWLISTADGIRTLWEFERGDDGGYAMRDVMTGVERGPIRMEHAQLPSSGLLLTRVVDDDVNGRLGLIGPAQLIEPHERDDLVALLETEPDGHEIANWYGEMMRAPDDDGSPGQ